MNKKLKNILELRDRSFKVYDSIRFKRINQMSVEEMQEIHDGLTLLLIESLGNYQPVLATEDCIIHPGEIKEIKTDIDKICISSVDENKSLEFTNEGIISSFGYLSFSLVRDYENGNRIMVTNNVPKEVEEEYDLCGYHWCNPITTKYFGPGVYRIEAGTTIGLAGLDNNFDLEASSSKDTTAVKDTINTDLFQIIKNL